MSKTAKDTAIEILKTNDIGVMATNNNGIPNSRYMTFAYIDSMIYTLAKKDAAVVKEIKLNPTTHILLGYTKDDMNAPYVEIIAKLTEIKDDTLKLKITNFFKDIFKSDADDMITLQLNPVSIKLMNDGEPQELHF